VPAVTVLVVVSWVPIPIVTVSATAGCASSTAKDAVDSAIESAGTWRTILILIPLDVLMLP
jgi:hypothetical protein